MIRTSQWKKSGVAILVVLACSSAGLCQNSFRDADKLINQKDFKKAEEVYRSIIQKGKSDSNRSNFGDAHVCIARLFVAEGQASKALDFLQEFCDSSEQEHDYCMARGGYAELERILLEQKKIEQARAIAAKLNDSHCPICASSNVLPISYGLQRPTQPRNQSQLTHYMGCVVPFGQPKWWCEKDHLAF